MDITKLERVSNCAKRIGKSTETVRSRIRNGSMREGTDYVRIDGVLFINKQTVKQ